MPDKEQETTCLKCFLCFPKPGKKFLFIFVAANLCIFWLIYKRNHNSFYVDFHAKQNIVQTVDVALYNISVFHIPLVTSKEMIPYYIEIQSNLWCFLYGINVKLSKEEKKCICIDNWFGLDCGIPEAVWKSNFIQEGKKTGVEIRRRDKPRRIISSIVIDSQFELLDINIQSTFPVIDVFLSVEEKSNYPSLLDEMKDGFLSGMQSKIMPVKLNMNLNLKSQNEWVTSMLRELWTVGWMKITDFRPDDLFLFSYVSSLISKDVLLFLKLYDGYSDPFFFELRPLMFNFQRQITSNFTTKNKFVPFKPFGCTFQYISLCNYDMMKVFTSSCYNDTKKKQLFEKNYWPLKAWTIGNEIAPSGWHCILCCKSDCIKDYVEHHRWLLKTSNTSLPFNNLLTNTSVINYFLNKNKWFDGEDINFTIVPLNSPYFAPEFVINNKYKYFYLLS